MSQPSCAGSLQLCALRISVLGVDGVPAPGAGNLYVTDKMIELQVESENEAGDDFTMKTGCGDIAFAYKDRDRIKFLNLTLTLSLPDPEITQMLVGGNAITNLSSQVVGYAYPRIDTQPVRAGVGVEAWSKRISSGGQATDYPYWRWVFPKTDWAISSRTLGNEIMTTEFTGNTYENSNFYNGPGNDIPSYVPTNRSLSYYADTTIPTASCGAQTLSAS